MLVDAQGRLLAHGNRLGGLDPSEQALVRDGLSAGAPLVRPVHRGDEEWLAAFVPVEPLGWGIVVAERGAVAFRGAERVRDYTLAWAGLALVLAAGLGALLVRGLTRPIRALSAVALRATEGAYETDAAIEGRDEIGQFGHAFNHMIGEVKRRDVEIRRWNEELQQRVDQRTAELKAAQDQILRTRRLAALGSLGAGVAHELNNPLTSVIGLATLVKKGLGDGPQAALLDTLLEQAKRASKIATDLRQFATREFEAAGQRFALTGPVQSALEHVAERLKESQVTLHTRFADKLPEVQGNSLQIQQLITHLVQNAVTAMPAGGELEVGLGAVEGEAVKIWVSDTGKGIAPEIKERIFDPFFSTKDDPTKLGMGLPICHTIVEAHHGKISVESTVNRGTTFTVLLPAAPPPGHIY
jgi:signal transduction histidine kinase